MRGAVVDLGSITTRLLLVDDAVEGRGSRRAPITRMGAGMAGDGRITDLALERVRSALESHLVAADQFGASRLRVVATAAARNATNRPELFALAEEVLGVEAELVSGADEGRLAFAGAVAGLAAPASGPCVLIDVGGGSTEISFGTTAGEFEGAYSADIGAITVDDTYLEHDPPWAQELSAALSVVELHFDDALRELPGLAEALPDATVIGVGGTITTMAAVEIGLDPYDPDQIHGFVLDRAAAEDVFRTLATEALGDRVHNPGLGAERAPLIVGGTVVCIEAMRHLAIEELIVSETDLLDGVAAEMLSDAGSTYDWPPCPPPRR